jgi:phosphohistidine phosphatase SixA
LLYKLSGQLNQTLSWVEKSKLFKSDLSRLIQNLTEVTEDVKKLTAKAHTPEVKKTLNLLYELIQRLEPLDQAAVQKFLQKEGIRARIF